MRSLPISSAVAGRYDGVAKTLHWLSFGLVAVQFAIGWTMPEIGVGRRPSELIEIHMSIGIAILVITGIRLAWRLGRGAPPGPYGAAWGRRTAKAVQVGLYLLLFLMPLSGWADASARGLTIAAFGIARLPSIAPTGGTPVFGVLHSLAACGLLGLIGLHAMAALYHHVVLRDRVLSRMIAYRD